LLQAIQSTYAALEQEAKSEAKNLDAFEAQRNHDFEIKKAETFSKVAKGQKNIVMSGKSGETILSQIMDLSTGKEAPANKK